MDRMEVDNGAGLGKRSWNNVDGARDLPPAKRDCNHAQAAPVLAFIQPVAQAAIGQKRRQQGLPEDTPLRKRHCVRTLDAMDTDEITPDLEGARVLIVPGPFRFSIYIPTNCKFVDTE